MKEALIAITIFLGPQAFAEDEHYEVTCFAEMRHKESGRIEAKYDKTRGGGTLEWARDLAEENVMEECSKELLYFDLMSTHTCVFTSCDQ